MAKGGCVYQFGCYGRGSCMVSWSMCCWSAPLDLVEDGLVRHAGEGRAPAQQRVQHHAHRPHVTANQWQPGREGGSRQCTDKGQRSSQGDSLVRLDIYWLD